MNVKNLNNSLSNGSQNSTQKSSQKALEQVFVPITDDIIYDHPEQIEGPLVPYNAGMECQTWLSIEINPDEDVKLTRTRRPKMKLHKPSFHLVAS